MKGQETRERDRLRATSGEHLMRRAPRDSDNARQGDNGALVVVWLASVQTLDRCLLRLVAPLTTRACHSAFLRAAPTVHTYSSMALIHVLPIVSNLLLGRLSRKQVIGASRLRPVRALLVLGGSGFAGSFRAWLGLDGESDVRRVVVLDNHDRAFESVSFEGSLFEVRRQDRAQNRANGISVLELGGSFRVTSGPMIGYTTVKARSQVQPGGVTVSRLARNHLEHERVVLVVDGDQLRGEIVSCASRFVLVIA
jgi:hypothetical protein